MQESLRKVDIFGVGISVVDYPGACDRIIAAARQNRSYAVSALATHGLIEAVGDRQLRQLVNAIDLVAPDGQPVRWAANLLHRSGMRDRVCGPDLMGLVCAAAAEHEIGVFLYGSTPETIEKLARNLGRRYPGLRIAGSQPDRFRAATPDEDEADIATINRSGAGIVLVGRGCPRQERWVAEHRGKIDAAMLAVGAAFDYYAENLARAPKWMQRAGLEWLFRLMQEPKRLFRRYLVTNSLFLWHLSIALLTPKRTS